MKKETLYKTLQKELGLRGKSDTQTFLEGAKRVYETYHSSKEDEVLMTKKILKRTKKNIKFKITEEGINNIPLEDTLYYNNPAHEFYISMKKVNELLSLDIDEYALIRISDRTYPYDYDLYYNSIKDDYVSNHGAVNDSKIFLFEPVEVTRYRTTLKFLLCYIPGKSILNIKDEVIRFVLILLTVSILTNFGFTLAK